MSSSEQPTGFAPITIWDEGQQETSQTHIADSLWKVWEYK